MHAPLVLESEKLFLCLELREGFQQNSPTIISVKYRVVLNLVSMKEQAKNRPWVLLYRLDLNVAGCAQKFETFSSDTMDLLYLDSVSYSALFTYLDFILKKFENLVNCSQAN